MQSKNLDLQATIFIVSLIISLLVLMIGFVVIVYYYRRKNLKKTFSQTLLLSQLEIREQTLQQISNELHDNIAQVASLIKINLQTIQINDPGKAEQKLNEAKDLVKQLIVDVKVLSQNLNGDRLIRQGLANAIAADVERINRSELFTASFHQSGDILPLDDSKTIILYRMVQEILNNVLKHSKASEINVSLVCIDNLVTITVADNGVGFDVAETLKDNSGSGIYNLKKRAALIQGKLLIESEPEKGTVVTVEVLGDGGKVGGG